MENILGYLQLNELCDVQYIYNKYAWKVLGHMHCFNFFFLTLF